MKRCIQCIMPDTVPGITFNERGICSLCQSYKKFEIKGEDALKDLFKGLPTDKTYNCAVPLSGGRDSSYVLYLAKEVYGLKPLAINFDNEYRNPQAVKNMENACSRLNVELCVIRSKRDICHKIVESNVRAAMNLGLPYVAISFCRPCDWGYHSAVYIECKKRGIPLILWGTSAEESTLATRTKAFATTMAQKYRKLVDIELYKTEYYSLLQRMELMLKPSSLYSRPTPTLPYPEITEVSMFDYITWDRRKLKDVIATKLGWEKPEGHITSWRTDCYIHEVTNFLFGKVFACTQDAMGYCNMINSGQMEREVALQQEEDTLRLGWDKISKLLVEHVNFTPKDVEKLGKMIREYPSPV